MSEISEHQSELIIQKSTEFASGSIEGIEEMPFFTAEQHAILFNDIEDWFRSEKASMPELGVVMYASKDIAISSETNVGIELPSSITTLLNIMLEDAKNDEKNVEKPIVKVLLERTGSQWSHDEDFGYHVDTNKIIFDENGNRIGYDRKRGPDKYMAFVDRPGTMVIEGKLDPALSHPEAIAIANKYHFNPNTGETTADPGMPLPNVVQLNPNKVYKVAVGDLLHSPPMHKDGLLITLSLVDEYPNTT